MIGFLEPGDLISYRYPFAKNEELLARVTRTELVGVIVHLDHGEGEESGIYNIADLRYNYEAKKIDYQYLLKMANDLSKQCGVLEKRLSGIADLAKI